MPAIQIRLSIGNICDYIHSNGEDNQQKIETTFCSDGATEKRLAEFFYEIEIGCP